MSSEITVVGNLTDDPQFKYLPDGTAVSRFTVASNQRVFDNGQWRDGEPTFVPCNAWRGLAENAVESLRKGDRVMVTGRLRTNTWTTQAGEQRSRLELTADELGPSLRFATARPAKTAAPAAAPAQTASQHASQAAASQANTSATPDRGQASQVGTGGPARPDRQQWPQPQAAAHAPSAPTSGNPARLAAASFATPASGATAGSAADAGAAAAAGRSPVAQATVAVTAAKAGATSHRRSR